MVAGVTCLAIFVAIMIVLVVDRPDPSPEAIAPAGPPAPRREPGTEVIAIFEPPPEATGGASARHLDRLRVFPPVIGEDGTVAFLSTVVPVQDWNSGIDTVLHVAPPGDEAQPQVRSSEDAGESSIYRLRQPGLEAVTVGANGRIVLGALLHGSMSATGGETAPGPRMSNSPDISGIYRLAGSQLEPIVEEGLTIDRLGRSLHYLAEYHPLAVSSNGHVALGATVTGGSTVPQVRAATHEGREYSHLLRVSPDGKATIVAAENAVLPGRNDLVLDLEINPSVNDRGEVSFVATVITPAGQQGRVMYLGDGGRTRQIAAEGDALPDGETLSSLFPPTINNRGDALFVTSAGTPSLVLADAEGLHVLAKEGGAAPGVEGTWQSFGPLRLNDRGDVAFVARVHDAETKRFTGEALFFRPAGAAEAILLAGAKQAVGEIPATPRIRSVELNARGEVLFDTATAGGGLYLRRADGDVIRIIGPGDRFAGGEIDEIDADLHPHDERRPKAATRSALNDFGQVAFHFELRDRRQGVAVFTPPDAGADDSHGSRTEQ